MSLFDLIREDAAFIAGESTATPDAIVLTNAAGTQTKTVKGIFSRHHLGVNREGVAYNNRTAHVTVSRSALDTAGYTYKNGDGEIDLAGHKVTVDGVKYVVNEWLPGDTAGLITIILGDWTDAD